MREERGLDRVELDRHALRWAAARERLSAYFRAAGLAQAAAPEAARGVVERVARGAPPESADEAILRGLSETHRLLDVEPPASGEPQAESLMPRATPLSIRRQSLAPALGWRRGRWLPKALLTDEPASSPPEEATPQQSLALDDLARRRRTMFAALVLATAIWSVVSFTEILAVNGLSALDLAQISVFAVLVLWLAQSFWTLAAGFGMRLHGLFARQASEGAAAAEIMGTGRVAILMPIYNEETARVFAGLEAIWRDLRREAPEDRRFDLFILSDSTDPDVWLAEVEAWRGLRSSVGDRDRIFYRRRDRNTGRKAGNIEDFIRRFGANYAYMLILDADSLMTGHSMLELAHRMDANPHVGLIQAPPKLVRGSTLFARVLQCAGELYGPLAAAGTAFWARGEGNYWGHNAIIRIRPFSELCGLPILPGRAPLGGQILSHDFVEAALMRRGGWQVWIAHDLAGSYEEPPPTIEDFAVRDRRWCQGNLQHIQVLFARNLHWVSRFHLGIGIMSYLTSPLWLIFLILAALQAWEIAHARPLYFLEGWPFPMLPVSVRTEATLLLVVTLGLLFVPKLLGLALAILDKDRRRDLGGTARLIASALLETLYSALLAPIMMLLHTRFVVSILSGAAIDWTPQRRAAGQSRVLATARTFFWPMVLGIAAAVAAWITAPLLFYWVVPVVAGLVLAVPLALSGASESIGGWLERRGLLLVAEERRLPAVMADLDRAEPDAEEPADAYLGRFVRAVLEPQGNALHIQLLRAFGSQERDPLPDRWMLERKAVYVGPTSLDRQERRRVLEDPELMDRLHIMGWLHWPGYVPEVLGMLRSREGTPPTRLRSPTVTAAA
jgi:membrane glycosyltransferase